MMTEAAPGDGEKDLSAAPMQPRYDFSVVQGFQVVDADHRAVGQPAGWRDALQLELETRATRFHHAVDSAIVLSNDGVIRWLGDPVARLSPGPSVLTPGAVVLADEALPDPARDTVRARIELWLAAMTRRILGLLFALDGLQEGSEAVRELARRLAEALGILEREPISGQLKALAQNDRAELRKLGVRFGAYYVFAPTLIKPAARTLALQLWSLHAPGDAGALRTPLAQVASSGRTSLLIDKMISREGYRVAGYRPCGERAVRVDVIERLAGIIRGAMMESQARTALGPARHGRSNGFVVSGQMTSLTGCAGEQFASILRSIGFRSVEMKRAEFLGSPPVVESPERCDPISQTENPETAADGQASPAIGGEPKALLDPLSASHEGPSDDAAIGPPDIPPDDTSSSDAIAAPDAASPIPPASTMNPDAEKNAELIIVWRPDRSALSRHEASKKTRRSRSRVPGGEYSSNGRQGLSDNGGRSPVATVEERRNERARKQPRLDLAADDRKAAIRPSANAGRRETVRYDEKYRQGPSDRDMSRFHPVSERQERPKVDPDSPFAKLLELRPLLEGKANKRP
jgi:ATP-dependent RNA helicase SUPV3L1/SUV3